MIMHLSTIVATAFVYTGAVSAQIFTSCDPLNSTCPDETALAQWSYTLNLTAPDASSQLEQRWTSAPGTKLSFDTQGAFFSIGSPAQAPTVSTNFTFLFGRVDIRMQAAPGTGIVSSIVLESRDLDEVDFVVLGGNTTSAETNYYGKGAKNSAIYVPVDSPQSKIHTYSLEWTSSSLVWSIDGNVVRTLAFGDANGGASFPQTPMAVKIGSWDGGKPGGQPGTIAWAGGMTDFTGAPFAMHVESVSITNYNPADYYNWSDQTGSFGSIKAYNTSSSIASTPDIPNNIDVAANTNASSTAAASILGGPTLVTTAASSSATATQVPASTSNRAAPSISGAGSDPKKNGAGKTAPALLVSALAAVFLGFVLFA